MVNWFVKMRNFKMKIWWIIWFIFGQFRQYSCYNALSYVLYPLDMYPWLVQYHYPGRFTTTMTPFINGTEEQIPSVWDTPDYRMEEPHFVPVSYKYLELERPYRNSPAQKTYRYFKGRGYGYQSWLMYEMGCYCNTVYRKFTLLAGCAVITSRHALTTATPTMLILRSYGHLDTLDGILGTWYDIDYDDFNSSMYMGVSRIHIHPEYTYDYQVNVSHPIPAMWDLAILAGQATFYYSWVSFTEAMLCARAGSGIFEYTTTIPREDDVSIVAGFQFIKSYNRHPMPWFRYVVHTKSHVWPCPKSDWQWYHCIMGEYWGKYGFDSGGGMNTGYDDRWRNNGLAGLCAFSLKLRSKQTVHYFTVLDTYPVLDFMYDAFLGLYPPVYLDIRFEDTKWAAPVLYYGEDIEYMSHTDMQNVVTHYDYLPYY